METGPTGASVAAGITAGQVMTSPVITVAADARVSQVAEILTSRRISAVPVVDPAGAVLGVVSERDLLARAGAGRRERDDTGGRVAGHADRLLPRDDADP
jgi:CBS domain-containing protein